MRAFLVSLALAVALGACATVPKELQGEYAQTLPRDSSAEGAAVRWGGRIIAVEPKADRTCFQVLSQELNVDARPRSGDHSGGRFLACRGGFYDPAVFTSGRDITVTGRIVGSDTRRVGEYDYRLPLVEADVIHLWRERPLYETRYAPTPFFWPGWYGYYYRPIYVHRSPDRRDPDKD
jgi:outer membrane lipoprotein